LRLIAQYHSGSFTSGVSGRKKENPMADALLHLDDFQPSRRPPQPDGSGLLFKSGVENIGRWVGLGHLSLVTEIIPTAMPTTDKRLTASPGIHIPISSAWERKRLEPRGFIGNSNRIQISGCLR
jgi:hypothetical protein